jgi:hypothetical protein
MASRIPRAAADAEGRQVLELLVNSWTLALRADGKSVKTLKTYGESADQLVAFLTDPPPLLEETAALLEAVGPVAGPRDVTATHLRAFMSAAWLRKVPRMQPPGICQPQGSRPWCRAFSPQPMVPVLLGAPNP